MTEDFPISETCQPLTPGQHRAKVFEFERAMLQAPQVELRVEHVYGDGWYARELHIPADVVVSGSVHKFINSNMLARGEMMLGTESGPLRVTAPYFVVSPPGTKRIVHTLTECVWISLHVTDERDPEKIREIFTTNDEQECLAMSEKTKLEGV